jgi:LCP family protein required for cell wall assembly
MQEEDLQGQSGRVRFRRAVTLLLMTLFAPGTAQLVSGNKTIGRFAVRVLLGVLAVGAIGALLAWAAPNVLVALFTNSGVLGFVRIVLIVLAVGWLLLFIDAWRLGRPLGLERRQRLTATIVTLTMAIVCVGALLVGSQYVAVARESIDGIFGAGKKSDPNEGRYNILLLGGDAGPDREGLRPDSITLVSVDEKTGHTAMFSFPRNLQRVPFPRGTVMHDQFPTGFSCDGCMLNAIYTWANNHKSLFPGVKDPGIVATKDAISGLTGLPVNYYVLIDLFGFRQLVDAVGGLTIDVKQDVPIGGISTDVSGTIKAGKQKLDGYHALWYARSRTDSSDYARMARQRCVMAAMLDQLDPGTVLLKFQAIAKAGKQVMSTDIPSSELGTFVDLAMQVKKQKITTVQFVPPLIKTSHPNLFTIKSKVRQAIDASEAPPTPKPTVKPTTSAPKVQKAPKSKGTKPPEPVGDLNSVCAAA